MDIIEIDINEFEKDIYNHYTELFPEEEQRDWDKIQKAYENKIEKFYKIVLENTTVGFFMLERINDEYPYYLDYFGIFKEYQNKGVGTQSIQKLLEKVGKQGLYIEIEKEDKNNDITLRRAEFYRKLGFKKIDSEYMLYNVLYTPYVYTEINVSKEDVDKTMFEYYIINCGKKEIKNNCKKIK